MADRGHEVTFLSSHAKKPKDHPKINDLFSETLHQLMSKSYNVDRFQQRVEDEESNPVLTSYSKISVDICETTLLKSQNDTVLQNIIHNEKFDLVIVNIIFGECGLLFAHHYGSKVIIVT